MGACEGPLFEAAIRCDRPELEEGEGLTFGITVFDVGPDAGKVTTSPGGILFLSFSFVLLVIRIPV
jgi:hypothetical protein